MKKILGLDLGSSSVGWAVVIEQENVLKIGAMGSRIIPLSPEDIDEFTKGATISKNAARTQRRTQRKGYDRYQQRRAQLTQFLRLCNMLPDESLIKLEKLQLWGLRAKAVSEQLSLPEIGRVLYHINQKRGYKSGREDNEDKKQRDYVENVMNRYKAIAERGITIGQLFFEELSKDRSKEPLNKRTYRTKEQVFPRRAYQEEFDRVMACQRRFYPEVLTDEHIDILRNQIIFYQRKLKSCKHLVSICDFEKRAYVNKAGKEVWSGPKVAPRSSPLAQVCKIWESVNNLTLKNRRGEVLEITPEQRRAMFEYLDDHPKLTLTDLYRILGIKRSDGWWGGKAIGKGLQGNTTKQALRKALGEDNEALLRFVLHREDTHQVNEETGEIVQIVTDAYLEEPLYRLWHLVYSIKEKDELAHALEKQFQLTDQTILDNLFALDFVKQGYANKSAKAMRRILPYLELGLMYSESCEAAGFRHSESLTLAENQSRALLSRLQPIAKNELRQPVVEKILNQMINVVNALMDQYGAFDEIRVELARELKQCRDQRNEMSARQASNERENRSCAQRIATEYQLTPTRSRIQKYKLWQESGNICLYCGQPVQASEFLRGFDVEIEHILPRSVYFDDSFANKVCACRKCNQEKNNRTAFDYMKSKSEEQFTSYIHRLEELYKSKRISKTKYERLLTPGDKIPTDFIDRQLRESQYIARKSREILSTVCRTVTATSGSVTDMIRHTWGWDRVLHNLNFERYQKAGMTEVVERQHNGNSWSEEVIKDWNKRLDHRHHAIDALVIACTKQGYIQRINDMSLLDQASDEARFQAVDADSADLAARYKELKEKAARQRLSKLEKYLLLEPHFSTAEVQRAADGILISFKAGKRGATVGKRYVHRHGKRVLMQQRVIVPRGALHEESLYGMIDRYVRTRNGEIAKTKQIVLRYPVESLVRKDLDFVVDAGMKQLIQERFDLYAAIGREKEVWKDLENNPLCFNDGKVHSVRCFTGLKPDSTITLERGTVKLGNNHHIALYRDLEGVQHECCVTFNHAVQRKKYGIPAIITDPAQVWDALSEGLPEQFLNQLPQPGWIFEMSLQQNEMFILGLEPEVFEEAMQNKDYSLLSKHLYRVQKLASKYYNFRLHIETKVDDKYTDIQDGATVLVKKEQLSLQMGKMMRICSEKAFTACYPQKVKISLLGEIEKV